MMNDNVLLKRHSLQMNLEYFIDESVYYRTHSDEFSNTKNSFYKVNEENR